MYFLHTGNKPFLGLTTNSSDNDIIISCNHKTCLEAYHYKQHTVYKSAECMFLTRICKYMKLLSHYTKTADICLSVIKMNNTLYYHNMIK